MIGTRGFLQNAEFEIFFPIIYEISDVCEKDAFLCPSERKCIENYYVCDGRRDCIDGADEARCGPPPCAPSQYRCGNGTCIPSYFRCNAIYDCYDRFDEFNCSKDKNHPLKSAINFINPIFQPTATTTPSCVRTIGNVSMNRWFAMDEGTAVMVAMNRIAHHPDALVISLDVGMDSVFPDICNVMANATALMVQMKRNVVSYFCLSNNQCQKSFDLETICLVSISKSFFFWPFWPGICTDPDWFQCSDGACIATALRCDNFYDCKDFSDEQNCFG